jgi:hypothetical protein
MEMPPAQAVLRVVTPEGFLREPRPCAPPFFDVDSSSSNSSIDKPVRSDRRRRAGTDGKLSPLTHSEIVGCETSMSSARDFCVVPDCSSQRLRRCMQSNIGHSYEPSIGRTYPDLPHASGMDKDCEDNIVTRLARAARLKFKRDVTLKEIGSWVGVTQPSVSGWSDPENGGPTLANGRKLALKLEVCVDWIYTGREPMMAGPPSEPSLAKLLNYWPDLDEELKGELVGQAREHVRTKTRSTKTTARR